MMNVPSLGLFVFGGVTKVDDGCRPHSSLRRTAQRLATDVEHETNLVVNVQRTGGVADLGPVASQPPPLPLLMPPDEDARCAVPVPPERSGGST
jgi:hypothetical protein